jgi:putative aminopeptidase FrvX
MNVQIDREYLLNTFRRVVETPSPVGYYTKLNPVLEALAAELGLEVTYDNRSTAYITLPGEDNGRTVMVGAHADTLGMVVRGIDANGWLRIRRVGGLCMPSVEGETVTVHTRDGREYTGLMICTSHSVHVFDNGHTLERNEETMRVLLDEPVQSKADVHALGIRNGDFVSVDPRMELTPNGYLKSRFIDDKGAIACVFAALRALVEQGRKPKYRTVFAFPYHEEIGIGGTYLPPEVEEYVAVDIGLIGPDCDGHERAVSICAKDATSPYDYDLTNRLIRQAEEVGCEYAVDVFYRYSTDANAALRAGNNIRQAAFGMAVYCSHGRERTHVDGLDATTRLILAYVMDV